MKRARFLPEGEQDALDAALYYEACQATLGTRFHAALASAVDRICEFPESGTPLSRHARRTEVVGFPYHLIYSVEATEILLIAVAHQSRRPAYWRKRKKKAGRG